MTDIIVAGVLIFLVGIAVVYIVKEKKNGAHCIGCPSAGCCGKHKKKSICNGCHTAENTRKGKCNNGV